MGIIESLIMYLFASNEVKKQKKSTASYQKPPYSSFAQEKAYLRRIDKAIYEIYKPFDLNVFDMPSSGNGFGVDEIEKSHITDMNAERKEKFRYLYTVAYTHTQSLERRTELIQTIMNYIYKRLLDNCLHNELLFVIDMYSPKDKKEIMIQQICRFIDAEYYLFKGNYINALKRLYQVLDWDDLLLNGRVYECYDTNGLETLYEAAIVNIINIYAVMGLPEMADETRDAFNAMITREYDKYDRINIPALDKFKKAYTAKDNMLGFYSFSDQVDNGNLFYDCYLGNYGGTDTYNISIGFSDLFTEEDMDSWIIEDNDLCPVLIPSLVIDCFGDIPNYIEAANEQRALIKKIFS